MKLVHAALAAYLVVGVVLAAGPREVAAQSGARGVVAGVVTDTALRVVPSADVMLFGTTIHLQTDARGRFEFTGVPPKEYMITVRRLGFLPVQTFIDVKGGDTLRVSYELIPVATAIGGVTVTAQASSIRLQEFEDRRSLGAGEFFTAEEMEKRGAVHVADVLRQSKTVELVPTRGNRLFAMSKRPAIGMGGQCPMQIFVDGAPYNGMPDTSPIDGGSPSSGIGGGGMPVSTTATQGAGFVERSGADKPIPVDLNSLVSAKELAGMEVYGGAATVPVKYNTGPNRMCGVILLWTKDR